MKSIPGRYTPIHRWWLHIPHRAETISCSHCRRRVPTTMTVRLTWSLSPEEFDRAIAERNFAVFDIPDRILCLPCFDAFIKTTSRESSERTPNRPQPGENVLSPFPLRDHHPEGVSDPNQEEKNHA